MSTRWKNTSIGDRSRLFAAILCLAVILSMQQESSAWDGKVTAISGCESITVQDGERVEEVGLYGIACPEENQPFFHNARLILTHIALGKYVEVTPVGEGQGGKSKALLRTMGNGCLVNERLISYGMAWVTMKHSLGKMCKEWKKIQSLARRHAIGLWADRAPVPPWEWKRRRIQQMLKLAKRQRDPQS